MPLLENTQVVYENGQLNIKYSNGALIASIATAAILGLTSQGNLKPGTQTIVPAGATQGTATLITNKVAIASVSTTASTKGVKLPVPVTGMEVTVSLSGTFPFKVYPNTGCKIGSLSTNTADGTKIGVGKSSTYKALNTTQWIVVRGA